MDDGKPTGPKAKWWSRPSTGRGVPSGPEAPASDVTPVAPDTSSDASPAQDESPPGTGTEPTVATDAATARADATVELPEPVADDGGTAQADAPAAAVVPAQARHRPLHEPDAYSTPPYGGPGPWAPAPPVQRPVPTPAHGTSLPPQYATAGAGTTAGGYAQHPPHEPHTQPQPGPQAQPHSHTHPAPPVMAPPAPAPVAAPAGERPQPLSSMWLQYDPWSAPGQPLTHHGAAPAPRRRRGALLIGALVLALVSGGVGGAVGAYVERNGGMTRIELPQAGPESADRAPDSVAGIAARALPSVVTLHVSGDTEQGTGTGFVLDEQGHILTNNHVVDPAGTDGDISVTFSGGETAKATLVGKDSGYDLAVVKVTGVGGLKPLPLGNSENVQVGDPVVAIGAPFDLQNTVTSGIISAKERPITAGGEKGDGSDISYVDALQTDAPINPGNSGGPLVDSQARVIGINSAIRAADTGAGPDGGQAGSIGLGFAIPINQGKRVAEELISTGKATHPVIGVSLDMRFTGDGARVGEKGQDDTPAVTPGGPAAEAGVKPGDVITKVDGRRVHSGEELIVKIRAHRPGDRLELTLRRGGDERTMTLVLGSADSS
ncbi:S1C family serine protease [Streptomyces peucetius]|uniref:Trypsin-like peptidase domain-containing protein n=1 Tax=Streptomyces peucetius TaxID=1950 RepID=A0ABY6IB49_STRPE|nr:trypsin-like peptidase domain-containing protein [Streptomyces peucetius]UYQ64231.1 trypsin-like peptidase domain-containing protein [Streptomyces peucetius]